MKIRLLRDLNVEARHGAVAGAIFEVITEQQNPFCYVFASRDGTKLRAFPTDCEIYEAESKVEVGINDNDRAWRELVYLDEMIMGLEERLQQNNFNPKLTSLEVELATHQLKLMRNCREAHSLRISIESKLL
ncbi:hypothetical protein [Kangiella sp.]|uniref:hypothetical protein n=1 Tax=Kangiella sp. TaxID=1920245 RepID=UPI003A90BC8C